MSKKIKKKNKQSKQTTRDFPAIVPESLIRQAAAFTAPRGRLEMGGLLIGHVDEQGHNVAVTGLFPEQLKESSGYCEFDGMWTALVAAACDHANQIGDEAVPKVRIIGWIHTHPDIGIFLSGIDVTTFRALRDATPDRRLMAVVVDPLREENGVFLTERQPNDYASAKGTVSLSSELETRYMAMLDRLEAIRNFRGLAALPCILAGPLRHRRLLQGVRDDAGIEMERGFFAAKREIHTMQLEMKELRTQISNLESLRHSQTRHQSDLKRLESELLPLTKRLSKLEEDQRATNEATQKSRSILHRLIQILRGKPSQQ
tara:strand:+ start:368 stop:1315 length:948 start_codon:yes stop_codon:yes gene_type:complete